MISTFVLFAVAYLLIWVAGLLTPAGSHSKTKITDDVSVHVVAS